MLATIHFSLLTSHILPKNLKIKVNLTAVFFCECKVWFSHSDSKVLRRIFVCKREEAAAGGWRKLHNEALHNLYSSPSIIRTETSMRMRWAVHISRKGTMRCAYKILVGIPGGERPLGRHGLK
jgi:hypothetical protein